MTRLLLSITAILFFVAVQAQKHTEKGLIGGNSISVMIPQGTLGDTYDHGIGVYGSLDYNFNNHLAARFDLGWNDVSGPETTYADSTGVLHTNHPNMSVWEFTGGFKASVSVVYIEARGGYFTGIHEWGFVPAVGLRIGRFDIQGSYTFAGDNQWFSGRVGFYWGK